MSTQGKAGSNRGPSYPRLALSEKILCRIGIFVGPCFLWRLFLDFCGNYRLKSARKPASLDLFGKRKREGGRVKEGGIGRSSERGFSREGERAVGVCRYFFWIILRFFWVYKINDQKKLVLSDQFFFREIFRKEFVALHSTILRYDRTSDFS